MLPHFQPSLFTPRGCHRTKAFRAQAVALGILLFACTAHAQLDSLPPEWHPAQCFDALHRLADDSLAPNRTIFRQVRVLNAKPNKRWKRFRTVIVRGDSIWKMRSSIFPTRKRGAMVITARKQFLTPGFVDMHMHHLCAADDLELFYLLNGITAAREMNGWADKPKLRNLIRSNILFWPDYFSTKFMYNGLNYDLLTMAESKPLHFSNDSIPLGQACDFHLISTMNPELREKSYALAERYRKPVALENVNSLDWANRSNSPNVYTLEKLGGLYDEQGQVRSAALDSLVARDVALVPCLNSFPMRFQQYAQMFITWPNSRFVHEAQMEEWTNWYVDHDGNRDSIFGIIAQRKLQDSLVVVAYRARGGRVLVGTETGPANPPLSLPGFSLHDEMEALGRTGMQPRQVLDAATLHAAETLGQDSLFGKLARGMRADMVLLRRDPLKDIRASREIEAVVIRGFTLQRPDLNVIDNYLDARN